MRDWAPPRQDVITPHRIVSPDKETHSYRWSAHPHPFPPAHPCPSLPTPSSAFHAHRQQRRTCSESEVRWWCRENFLSVPTLERLDSIRKQFRQQLCEVGFAAPVVPNNRASGRDAAAAGGFSAESNNWRNKKGEEIKTMAAWERDGSPTPQDSDKNAGNISLVQSVLVAGLYPHVAAFRRPNSKLKVPLNWLRD